MRCVMKPCFLLSSNERKLLLYGGALFCVSVQPCPAQPDTNAERGQFEKNAPSPKGVKQQAVDLRNALGPIVKNDPARAIALVDEFLRAHPNVALSDAALLIQLKAGAQRDGLHDFKAALQTYRTARAGFSSQNEPRAAWAEADLVRAEAELLLRKKDAAGAAMLLSEQWPLIARSNANRERYAYRSTEAAAKTYVRALDAAGHKSQVPDILAGHLLQSPELLNFQDQASDLGALLVGIIVERLTKAERDEEAVRWVRLRYAVCAYNVEALDGATLFLGKTWHDAMRTRMFGAAQSDAQKPNPLREVALPELLSSETARTFVRERAGELEDEMAQTGDGARVPDLVGLYLASDKVGAAMEWAWREAGANPGEPESVAQVCRVFKAADLNLVRAEEFLNWIGGKGENPVPAFLVEHSAEAELLPATLKTRRERKAREKATLASEWQAVQEAPRGVKLGLVNLGVLEPQKAWEAGALPVEDTIRLINEQRVRNFLSPAERSRVRRELGDVLGQQLSEMPMDRWPKMDTSVKLTIADVYRSKGDARAVPIYLEMIETFENQERQKPGSFQEVWLKPLSHLGMFYSEQKQYLQSAQTWERWREMPMSDEWHAEWRFLAARAYAVAGEKSKAQQLYAEVPQFKNAWLSGLAVHDQANTLIHAGQHEAARQMLMKSSVEWEGESIAVGLKTLLAYSYYHTGEFELAKRYSQQALKQAATPKFDDRLRPDLNVARSVSNYSQQWPNIPFLVEPPQLYAVANEQEKITRRFFVRSFRDVPFEVRLTDSNIKVQVAKSASQAEYFVEKEVIIEVAPQTLSRSVDAMLIVSNPLQPAFEARIPIHIEVPPLIRLSSSQVFFGQVKAEVENNRTLTLSALVPFRVSNVSSDSAWLTAEFSTEAQTKHQIKLSFRADRSQQFHSGSIRLQTDVPSQSEIQVPFAAHTN